MAKSAHRIRIRAPRERVFDALTTRHGLRSWYTASADGDFAVGKEITLSFDGKDSFRWHQTRFQPGQLVQWTCLAGPGAAAGTTVTYSLEDAGPDQTVAFCEHDGWPDDHVHLATCNTLWGILMGRLRDFSETGKSSPVFA